MVSALVKPAALEPAGLVALSIGMQGLRSPCRRGGGRMAVDCRLLRDEQIVHGRLALTVPASQVRGTGIDNPLYPAS